MKIAFTHNLQLSTSEDEAEFDRPETVAAITEALRRLGHMVEPIDVAGPASRIVARLEALSPDMVFNTAEGSRGKFREAFYPALFDRLGLPFTGSDAYVCMMTLDKQMTKMVVAGAGVVTPKWIYVENACDVKRALEPGLNFPVIVKPNFEGSSIGITQDSIVETPQDLKIKLENLLMKFPAGVLVEEFIVGRDLTVPFVEKASPKTNGVLEPAVYCYDESAVADRKYQIYDYEMKSVKYDAVHVKVPADIDPEVRKLAIAQTQRVVSVLGIRDMARIDFRLTDDGRLYFIEINALPSLEPGASIYESGALAGLKKVEDVLGAIVNSAAERYGLLTEHVKSGKKKGQKVRVGLTFNMRRPEVGFDKKTDTEAEYDSPETIDAIKRAIESYGHEVVELEATQELPTILPNAGVDVVFNIAEGPFGRTRESLVPALLELLDIPYTGSDPTTMSLALDKGLAKRLVSQAGIHTPPFVVMETGREKLPKNFSFPAIAKPIAEGSSKGILSKSVVTSEEELRTLVQDMVQKYRQGAIVESFLPGREFTVALLGENKPRVLPPLEVVFTNAHEKHPIYSFENKFFNKNIHLQVPAKIDDHLRRDIERAAKGVFAVLDCRDLARVDFRLDAEGNVSFIECNPLPGLAPGFSDFCLIGMAAGMDYRTLIGEILSPALRRMKEKNKEKILEGRF